MYMNPTLPAGGVLCPTHAIAHSIAFLSMHIGSGPGVAGLSGMQVKPFLPSRSMRILPSASITTMLAPCDTLAGAADIALLIMALSDGPFFASLASAAQAFAATPKIKNTVSTPLAMLFALLM